jgi:hypothetical protein
LLTRREWKKDENGNKKNKEMKKKGRKEEGRKKVRKERRKKGGRMERKKEGKKKEGTPSQKWDENLGNCICILMWFVCPSRVCVLSLVCSVVVLRSHEPFNIWP